MTERQYSDFALESMQASYGPGFLSPGAGIETRQLLKGYDLDNKTCLDLGCGVGGSCLQMATEHNPLKIVGVDVEAEQVRRARELAQSSKASNVRLELINAEEPLPFPRGYFDLVLSKDVLCHVRDKRALCAEVLRVLKPGGSFVLGDWQVGTREENMQTFHDWAALLKSTGLLFHFETLSHYQKAFAAVGFSAVECKDHTEWSRNSAKEQLVLVTGEHKAAFMANLGEEGFQRRLAITRARLEGLSNGSIEHWHIHGCKT